MEAQGGFNRSNNLYDGSIQISAFFVRCWKRNNISRYNHNLTSLFFSIRRWGVRLKERERERKRISKNENTWYIHYANGGNFQIFFNGNWTVCFRAENGWVWVDEIKRTIKLFNNFFRAWPRYNELEIIFERKLRNFAVLTFGQETHLLCFLASKKCAQRAPDATNSNLNVFNPEIVFALIIISGFSMLFW